MIGKKGAKREKKERTGNMRGKSKRKRVGKGREEQGGKDERKKGRKCEMRNGGKKERERARKGRDKNSGKFEGEKRHLDGDREAKMVLDSNIWACDGDGEIGIGIRTPRWKHHEEPGRGWRYQDGKRKSLWKHWDWHGDT